MLFLFVTLCPFCSWTCVFVQEVLLCVDWINFCPVWFEYVLQFLGGFFEVQMFHMLTQSDLVIFNRGILSLGTPDGWAGKRGAPGGVSQCPHLFQRGAVGTDPPSVTNENVFRLCQVFLGNHSPSNENRLFGYFFLLILLETPAMVSALGSLAHISSGVTARWWPG